MSIGNSMAEKAMTYALKSFFTATISLNARVARFGGNMLWKVLKLMSPREVREVMEILQKFVDQFKMFLDQQANIRVGGKKTLTRRKSHKRRTKKKRITRRY